VQIGGCGYKRENIPEDLPALSFERECVVCHESKKGINLCPECWQLIRKCLDIKGDSRRDGWTGWGVDMNLDLSNVVKLLRTDKEGNELLEEKMALERKQNNSEPDDAYGNTEK
jgi:uncharacterized UBP type Zn finger protein